MEGGVGRSQGSGDISFDGGFGILAAVGTRHPNGFRVEGELGYRQAEYKAIEKGLKITAAGIELKTIRDIKIDAKLKTISLMGNGYFDFETGAGARPYIGGHRLREA